MTELSTDTPPSSDDADEALLTLPRTGELRFTELRGDTRRSRLGYVFDTDFSAEDERLALGEDLWDEGTRRRLVALGVGAGWRCLEVGAGRGSVAGWLRDRVGVAGEVVAADLRLDRLEWLSARGVRLLATDLAVDQLPRDRFDLVHARLVVGHLADRAAAVARMCAALRPGGYLMLEDTDGTTLFSHPTRDDFHRAVRDAAYDVMHAAGYHSRCGLLDAELVARAGLTGVHSEGRSMVVRGGTAPARWFSLWLEHLRPAMLDRGRVGAAAIDAALADLADPAHRWLSQTMITVTGRRPQEVAG